MHRRQVCLQNLSSFLLPYPSLTGIIFGDFLGRQGILDCQTNRSAKYRVQSELFGPSYDVVRRFADALNYKMKADFEISQAG